MQILLINDVLYGILSGAYSTVARIYSIMLDLAGVTSGDRTLELGVIGSFSNITTAIYTIAGVFMLFRVTIAMINMLINPDMVSDRNAGAGKILTRVITSVAMLIIFIPNGWVFGDNGILNRLERGLLAEDGLINRILPSGVSESTSTKESKDLLVENVYAADSLDCWYLYVNSNDQSKNADSKGKHINISKVYHITYRADDKGRYVISSRDATHREEEQGVVPDNAGISYNVASGNLESDITDVITASVKSYSALGRPIVAGDVFKDGKLPNKCPKYFKVNSSGSYVPYADYTTSGDSWLKSSSSNNPRGGFSSISSLNKYVDKYKDQLLVKSEDTAEATADLLDGVKPQAVRFGQNTMGSFLQCSKGKDDECEGIVANSLTTSAGNDAVVNAIDQKTMTMDFMIGLIAAVGIAIWLLIMCVDVIVRRFKLILLQIIAPIPIISYSDPKDKMFSQWAKMYMTVYADLFLKLIAIGFATALLENIGYTLSGKGLLVFFYIVAILVFAKVLPSLLSELFGFKMGNSFKDITGMGKAALGFGAGAVAGAAVGAYTGQGLGRLTGFASGALRGAGSGSAGNITGGAKSIAAVNTLKKQGLNWFDRMRYQGLGALGIDPNLSERAELDQIKQARAQVGNINSRIGDLESSVDRTPEVDAFKRAITNGVISDPTGDKLKAIRAAYASAYDSYGKVDDQGNSTQISQIGFSDVRSKINENEWKAVYGDTDKNLKVSHNAWGSGYRDAKRSIVNAHKLVLADKESVNFINEYGGDNGKALLDFKISEDTTFDQITGADYKGNTFTPMKALEDIEAAKTQALTFADQKNPNSK